MARRINVEKLRALAKEPSFVQLPKGQKLAHSSIPFIVRSEAQAWVSLEQKQQSLVNVAKSVIQEEACKSLGMPVHQLMESYEFKYHADATNVQVYLVNIQTNEDLNARSSRMEDIVRSRIEEAIAQGKTSGFIKLDPDELETETCLYQSTVDKLDVMLEPLNLFCRARIPKRIMDIVEAWNMLDSYGIFVMYVSSMDIANVYGHFSVVIIHDNYIFILGSFQ